MRSVTAWIARGAFQYEGGEAVAYVLRSAAPGEDPVAERRVLSFAREVGEGFLVRSGIEPGDVLVVHPLDRLEDGAALRVLETDDRRVPEIAPAGQGTELEAAR